MPRRSKAAKAKRTPLGEVDVNAIAGRAEDSTGVDKAVVTDISTAVESPETSCPIMEIPGEIRNKIYAELLSADTLKFPAIRGGGAAVNLACTNKMFRDELLTWFWKRTKVEIYTDQPRRHAAGRFAAAAIKNLPQSATLEVVVVSPPANAKQMRASIVRNLKAANSNGKPLKNIQGNLKKAKKMANILFTQPTVDAWTAVAKEMEQALRDCDGVHPKIRIRLGDQCRDGANITSLRDAFGRVWWNVFQLLRRDSAAVVEDPYCNPSRSVWDGVSSLLSPTPTVPTNYDIWKSNERGRFITDKDRVKKVTPGADAAPSAEVAMDHRGIPVAFARFVTLDASGGHTITQTSNDDVVGVANWLSTSPLRFLPSTVWRLHLVPPKDNPDATAFDAGLAFLERRWELPYSRNMPTLWQATECILIKPCEERWRLTGRAVQECLRDTRLLKSAMTVILDGTKTHCLAGVFPLGDRVGGLFPEEFRMWMKEERGQPPHEQFRARVVQHQCDIDFW